RLLHSGDADGRRQTPRGAAAARSPGYSDGAERQHLSLHRLPQDLRRRGAGRPAAMTRARVIGQALPRHDALAKVTGEARYPGDLLDAQTLRLKVVFAGRPHARIVEIDTNAALAVPGVVAVLTADDVPYNAFGLIDHDQPVICGDVVRFAGDKVAVVVAE